MSLDGVRIRIQDHFRTAVPITAPKASSQLGEPSMGPDHTPTGLPGLAGLGMWL